MNSKRRQILQYAATGSLLLGLPSLHTAMAPVATLRTLAVTDDAALPRFTAGQVLTVDIAQTAFAGDGIYLYPAWGTPRPWHVSLGHAGMLEFRNPGSGQLTWSQARVMMPLFAGRLANEATPGVAARAALQTLRVPRLPA